MAHTKINRSSKILIFCFLSSLLLQLISMSWLPSWPFTFFAPSLVLSFYYRSCIACLWIALITGCFIDLLSAETHFGFYALNYCLTSWFLYSQKKHFFEENLSTLPLMTWLFSLFSTSLQLFIILFFERKMSLTLNSFGTDFILMPGFDAIFAFFAFTLPLLLLKGKQVKVEV